jgi:hypothetical protein
MDEKFSLQELNGMLWVCRLTLFMDFTLQLNDVSNKLQGFGKAIEVMFVNITSVG